MKTNKQEKHKSAKPKTRKCNKKQSTKKIENENETKNQIGQANFKIRENRFIKKTPKSIVRYGVGTQKNSTWYFWSFNANKTHFARLQAHSACEMSENSEKVMVGRIHWKVFFERARQSFLFHNFCDICAHYS